MNINFIRVNLDIVGFTTSILCAIHCFVLPFILAMSPLAGLSVLDHPFVELAIILFSFVVACFALTQGFFKQHHNFLPFVVVVVGFLLIFLGQFSEVVWMEIAFTSSGATIVAVSHYLNWLFIKKVKSQFLYCQES